MLFAFFLALSSWAQSNPTAVKAEGVPEPAQLIYKAKNPTLGRFEIECRQRVLNPDKELSFRFSIWSKKNKKTSELFTVQTYNSCGQYKFKLSNDKKLIVVAPPGERSDETGSQVTTTYNWDQATGSFVEKTKVSYSPYLAVRSQYRKILATAALPKAEKLIIANQKKIEDYLEIHNDETKVLCEDFYNAYKTYGENLFKEKDYKQSFDIFLSLKKKFGAPQNAFFDTKSKNSSIVIVCPIENLNSDLSEDHFYTFAKRYLDHSEYVPYMIKKAKRSIQENTDESKELALQILKFVSTLLKSAPHPFQLEHQKDLVAAWNSLIHSKTDHPEYDRLLNEDTQLIFLLAEIKRCRDIPPAVTKRIAQKDDNQEILKSMTLAAADDFYADGLEKSAVFEYKQFVLGRVLLKKCDQIPKAAIERYFKYTEAQAATGHVEEN